MLHCTVNEILQYTVNNAMSHTKTMIKNSTAKIFYLKCFQLFRRIQSLTIFHI